MERIDKINYYLNISESVSERSTCLKKHWGSIIVKNDEIISTGFNGAPRGVQSCLECDCCNRENSERGSDYNQCLAVHSEQNAIIHASRNQMLDSDMYLVGKDFTNSGKYVENAAPCALCKRMIINSGIKRVIVRDDKFEYRILNVEDWIKNRNILLGGY